MLQIWISGYFYSFYVYEYFVICIYILWMRGAQRGQKWASDSLELELGMSGSS